MARTALARWFMRLAHDLHLSRRSGRPLESLRDDHDRARESDRANGTLSRRRVLAGAGAAATVGALSGRASIARATTGRTVAIVGGGIAGLACALDLADRGIASTVYEASGRVGGRMFSNTTTFPGLVSEWGGELIDSGHTTVQALATRFGLELDDLLAAEPSGSNDTYFFFGWYYSKADAVRDFRAIFPAVEADLDAAGYPTTYDAFTAAGASLAAMTVRQWIESRVPGGIGSPLGALLDVAYAEEYAADTTDQSALNLLYLLAFQPTRRGFAIYGESDEAFHIRGGSQLLPRAIADALGPAVRTGHRLLDIRRTSGGRVQLAFERGSSVVDVIADHAVLALPFAVLRDFDLRRAGFDALKLEAINDLGRGVSSKIQLQFARRLWNERGPWPRSNGASYTDVGSYQGSWDASRAQPGTRGLGVFFAGGTLAATKRTRTAFATVSASGARRDVRDTLEAAEQVFPGLSALYEDRATLSLWHYSDLAKLSYAYYRPGQYTRFGGYEAARQGNVYFAGEHTSIDFQGYMEGGASTGQRAANQVARRL